MCRWIMKSCVASDGAYNVFFGFSACLPLVADSALWYFGQIICPAKIIIDSSVVLL